MRSLTSALKLITSSTRENKMKKKTKKEDQTKKNDSHGGDKMRHFEFISDNDRNQGKLSMLLSSFMTHNFESGK